jgi:hypothetical protein
MARYRLIWAVFLALVLVITPSSMGWAEAPSPGSGGLVDGHPWDDQVTDGTNPTPGDPTDGHVSVPKSPVNSGWMPMTAGAAKWVGDVMLYVMPSLRHTNTMAKHKSVGLRRR